MRVPVLLGIVVTLLLSACQTGAGKGSSDISATPELPPAGSQWRLVSGLPDKLSTDVDISLDIGPDGSISGSGGCNRYNGRMSIENGRLALSPLAATKRGCMGTAGKLEPQFFAAMAKVNGLSSDAANLRLMLDGGGELRFEARGSDSQ